MKGALIHGVLLAIMLVYGYRTWTRDKTVQPNVGNVVLWNKSEADLVSIEYRSPKKIVKLERKPEGYWWGSDTTIETKVKPKTDAAAGSAAGSGAGSGSAGSAAGSGSAGSGSAGSGAGSGSAAPSEPATIEEEETGRKVREFPLGETGEKLVKAYASARALRDLGKPNEAAKKDYKLGTKPLNIVTMKDGKQVSTSTITVTFKDGSSRSFVVGGSVYGGSDKYVMDQQSGKAYVLSKDLLSGLEIGESSLHLTDPRGFDATKIAKVTLEANAKSKSWDRITSQGENNQQVKTWADPATKKADQTAANFIDNANNLRPTEYASNLKISDLTPVMKLTYKDERGGLLGTLSLFKREKPGQLAEGQELDPANPPKGELEYYIVTEKTRVPAVVRKDTAQRAENDIETVFSGKQAPPKSIDPKGNPFGNVPPGHGGPPGHGMGTPPGMPAPSGAPAADPHGHGAPPAGAGSAVKPGIGVTPPGAGAGSGTKPPLGPSGGAGPTPGPDTKKPAAPATAPKATATPPAAPKATTTPAPAAPKATTTPPTTAPKPATTGSATKPPAPPAPPPPSQ